MFKHGFPPKWSTLKKLIWLVGSGIAGAAAGVWKTVTGTLLHLTDALASPMQKCEVTLEPIQDLHGQDAPYPAGGGKNKLNTEGTDTNNGYVSGKYLNNAGTEIGGYEGYITEYTPIKPSTEYTLSGIYGSAPSICFYDSNKNYISSVQYLGVTSKSFTTPADAAYYRASVKTPDMETSGQLEEGSTATPWSPYENICPITGRTGCEVQSGGVNLLTPFENGFSYVYIPKDTQIIASSDNGGTLEYFAKDKTRIDYWTLQRAGSVGRFSRGFKLKADAYYWRFTDNTDNVQLEIGTTMHDYVAPTGTTASVTFPETVYGGKYEFVSGSGQSKMAIFTLTGGFSKHPTLTDAYYRNNAISNSAAGLCVSNMFKYKNTSFSGLQNGEFTIDTNYTRVAIRAEGFNSDTEFNNFLSANPLQIVVPLATPTPISLTPQEISTLKGVNNVWSDANGNITLIYKAQAE